MIESFLKARKLKQNFIPIKLLLGMLISSKIKFLQTKNSNVKF